MKKANEELEKIKKAFADATELVANSCAKVISLDRLLSTSATESARLNKQASALLEDLFDTLSHAWRDLGTYSLNTDALDTCISVAADKAAKLEKQASDLSDKLYTALADLDV